jgi:chromosome segregation protein
LDAVYPRNLERFARCFTLLTQGDGISEAGLRAEAAQIDPDAVVGRLVEIDLGLTTLGERREELSAQRTRAEAVLADMREGRDAAAMAQQAEDALAEARAVTERYATLHVARVLLRSGIDRFRKEQQGPLLRAAGRHFALLTGGRYERLIVDYDSTGRTVLLAIRDTGAECPVEALSEGARDQLYLALRIAAVEAYAVQAEPLPFIADDLLVHFDDARATSAIALLAELGQTTQVILFTHHDHIATLAAQQVGVAIQHMPPIAVSSPAAVAVA